MGIGKHRRFLKPYPKLRQLRFALYIYKYHYIKFAAEKSKKVQIVKKELYQECLGEGANGVKAIGWGDNIMHIEM